MAKKVTVLNIFAYVLYYAAFSGIGSIIAYVAQHIQGHNHVAHSSFNSVWTYLPKDAPNFHKGNAINLAASIVILVLAAGGAVYLKLENDKRDRGERDHRLDGLSEEEVRDLGYRHPKFRYQL